MTSEQIVSHLRERLKAIAADPETVAEYITLPVAWVRTLVDEPTSSDRAEAIAEPAPSAQVTEPTAAVDQVPAEDAVPVKRSRRK